MECRNVPPPRERELCWNNIGWRLRTPPRRERHHGANTSLDFRYRQRGPTAEAVPHDANPSGIEIHFRIPRGAREQLIEEQAYIRHTVRNPGLHSRRLLLAGLTFPPSQFRRD